MFHITEEVLMGAFIAMMNDPECSRVLVVGETFHGVPVKVWLDSNSDIPRMYRLASGLELNPGVRRNWVEINRPGAENPTSTDESSSPEPTFQVLSSGNNAAFEIIEHGTGTPEAH